jgi:DNA-binding NarL/FixJ family response regulator
MIDSPSSEDVPMTARQLEVAQLAAEGLGYAAIGKRLHISPHTARAHVITIANRIPGESGPLRRVMRWMLAGRSEK